MNRRNILLANVNKGGGNNINLNLNVYEADPFTVLAYTYTPEDSTLYDLYFNNLIEGDSFWSFEINENIIEEYPVYINGIKINYGVMEGVHTPDYGLTILLFNNDYDSFWGLESEIEKIVNGRNIQTETLCISPTEIELRILIENK